MPLSRRAFLRTSGAAALAPLAHRGIALIGDPDNEGLCRKLASDPLRPQYHLLPAHNWMNDPNGPIYFRGRYHMFHQYNPQGAIWGNMNWAHATSTDLIHWQHEPVALSPTRGGPDQDGVFSGSAVLDRGVPTLIYTGVAPPKSESDATLRDGVHTWRETQCLATAQDEDLRTWTRWPEPVIAAPPPGLAVTGFRDPYVWRENDRWLLILGSGTRNRGGAILLYSSRDLRRWTYLHPLVEGGASGKEAANPVDSGDMWECPDFFPLGNKHVLLTSTMGKVRWKVGTYANQRFTSEQEGVADWGSYYAAKTMVDRDGKRILWGWIPETRPDSDLLAAGWAGVMSLPRVLSLSKRNTLQTEVSPLANQLRTGGTGLSGESEQCQVSKLLDSFRIHNLAAELDLTFQSKGDNFILVLQSEDGKRFVSISCTNQAGGSRELRVNNYNALVPGASNSPLHLHMFLDGSVLEIFANSTAALTARVYEVPSSPLRLRVEGNAEVVSFEAWQMKPISKDRLTGSLCS